MATNTIIFSLRVQPKNLTENGLEKKLYGLGKVLFGQKEDQPITIPMGTEVEKLIIFKEENGGHASLRVYGNGTLTLDVQYYIPEQIMNHTKNPYNMKYIRSLHDKIEKYLGDDVEEIRVIHTPIKRGQGVWPYVVTADCRLIEYDFDKVVFEETSPYQRVQIYHSRTCGNVLLLDEDLMLGESDLIYTTTVCALDTEDYKDKEVLILGGGDGGILHELLKLQPKFVLMAEIDEVVIKACRTHMRSICGDAMDEYEGSNYTIAIEDCVKVLYDTISSGKKYDYVINDLTEFPVEKAVKKLFTYDFATTSLITELSLKAVKDTGKVLARGNCVTAYDYQPRFESDITKMGAEFKRKVAFVPSFQENYSFYEIWKMNDSLCAANQ